MGFIFPIRGAQILASRYICCLGCIMHPRQEKTHEPWPLIPLLSSPLFGLGGGHFYFFFVAEEGWNIIQGVLC